MRPAAAGQGLLDLSPGVTAIRLVDPETDAATASLEDAARIRPLVTAVLAARAVPRLTPLAECDGAAGWATGG